MWVTWAWHGIYEKTVLIPLKQPPLQKPGSCTKACKQFIPLKVRERKPRRWVIAKLVLWRHSYLLNKRRVLRHQDSELKQAQGGCRFQEPHVSRCARGIPASTNPAHPCLREESTRHVLHNFPQLPVLTRVGAKAKIVVCFKSIFELPCFGMGHPFKSQTIFLFRGEIWSGRHFNARPSFLLTSGDLKRLFVQYY